MGTDRMTWPLRSKLFVTLGGGALALALVMSLLVNHTVVDEVHHLEDQNLLQTQAAIDGLLAHRRSQLLERCRLVSKLPHFKTAMAVYDPTIPASEQTEAMAAVSDAARRILGQMNVDLLTLTGIDGRPLLGVGAAIEEGINDLTPIGFIAREAVQQGTGDGFLILGGELIYVAAVQMEVGGLQLGSLCLGTRLDDDMTNSLEKMTGSAVALLSEDGITARSDGAPGHSGTALRTMWESLKSGDDAHRRRLVEIEDSRYRTLWVPLTGPQGRTLGAFVVLRSEDQAVAFLANVRSGLIGITGAATVFALFFSFLFARQITNPIRKLTAFTKRVSHGDLQSRVFIGTRDELAELGDSFNRMTESLLESRRSLEDSSLVLEERIDELETTKPDLPRRAA